MVLYTLLLYHESEEKASTPMPELVGDKVEEYCIIRSFSVYHTQIASENKKHDSYLTHIARKPVNK